MGKTYKKRTGDKKMHDPGRGKKGRKHNLVGDYNRDPNSDDFFASNESDRKKRDK